jgi:ferredoxin-NADP reductase
VELVLQINGQEVCRHYSVSAQANGRFSITVKRVEQGQVSNWLHEHLRPGMTVNLHHPQGRFCYEGQRKVLFLVAGSGITPAHSMVNALLDQGQAQRPDIQVMAQFRRAEDVIFKDDLQRWAQHGVKVNQALSSLPVAANTTAPSPRLDAQRLQAFCPDLRDRDIYLCGPAGFMTEMLAHLESAGVDMARVHTERFVSSGDATQPDPNFMAEGAEIHFSHLGKSITLTAADQGKTLLQAATDHGLALESGCCQGMCGTCRLVLHEGQVSGNVLGKVVYLCTSYPASRSVVLDA